jgi:hypothetical protein
MPRQAKRRGPAFPQPSAFSDAVVLSLTLFVGATREPTPLYICLPCCGAASLSFVDLHCDALRCIVLRCGSTHSSQGEPEVGFGRGAGRTELNWRPARLSPARSGRDVGGSGRFGMPNARPSYQPIGWPSHTPSVSPSLGRIALPHRTTLRMCPSLTAHRTLSSPSAARPPGRERCRSAGATSLAGCPSACNTRPTAHRAPGGRP